MVLTNRCKQIRAVKFRQLLDFKKPSGYDPAYFRGGRCAHLFYQAH